MGGCMNYGVEMGLGAIISVPSFIEMIQALKT
jgi:hypothetical protein